MGSQAYRERCDLHFFEVCDPIVVFFPFEALIYEIVEYKQAGKLHEREG
jgi:hypothetical protein